MFIYLILEKKIQCQLNFDKAEKGTTAFFFFLNAMRGYEENHPIPYFPKKYTCNMQIVHVTPSGEKTLKSYPMSLVCHIKC